MHIRFFLLILFRCLLLAHFRAFLRWVIKAFREKVLWDFLRFILKIQRGLAFLKLNFFLFFIFIRRLSRFFLLKGHLGNFLLSLFSLELALIIRKLTFSLVCPLSVHARVSSHSLSKILKLRIRLSWWSLRFILCSWFFWLSLLLGYFLTITHCWRWRYSYVVWRLSHLSLMPAFLKFSVLVCNLNLAVLLHLLFHLLKVLKVLFHLFCSNFKHRAFGSCVCPPCSLNQDNFFKLMFYFSHMRFLFKLWSSSYKILKFLGCLDSDVNKDTPNF